MAGTIPKIANEPHGGVPAVTQLPKNLIRAVGVRLADIDWVEAANNVGVSPFVDIAGVTGRCWLRIRRGARLNRIVAAAARAQEGHLR